MNFTLFEEGVAYIIILSHCLPGEIEENLE
jgi:hypothetical protein